MFIVWIESRCYSLKITIVLLFQTALYNQVLLLGFLSGIYIIEVLLFIRLLLYFHFQTLSRN